MNIGSVASAAVSLKAAQNAFQVQIAVAAKLQDSQQAQGDAVVKLIEAASNNLDQASSDLINAVSGGIDIRA